MMIVEKKRKLRRETKTHEFDCADCKQHKSHTSELTTGYATFGDSDDKVCFECCGKRDADSMAEHGKATMYLTGANESQGWAHVSNWPGTLQIRVRRIRKGRHNIAGCRYDVWFAFQGAEWHGTQFGDNTQICRVKRLKKRKMS